MPGDPSPSVFMPCKDRLAGRVTHLIGVTGHNIMHMLSGYLGVVGRCAYEMSTQMHDFKHLSGSLELAF